MELTKPLYEVPHFRDSHFDPIGFEQACADKLRETVVRILDPNDQTLEKMVNINPPVLDTNALTVIERRYLLKDPSTKQAIETPLQMYARVALKLVSIDLQQACTKARSNDDAGPIMKQMTNLWRRYFEVMKEQYFVPAGRTLANDKTSVPNW